MTSPKNQQRIIELETKITYQEILLAELNSVVINQQNQLDLLSRKIEKLTQQILNPTLDHHVNEEPPPPHY